MCTGDAAVNGPRNKLWDANIAEWPNALERAIDLKPVAVLPGHGEAGGMEILIGQARFLLDLYSAVEAQVKAGQGAYGEDDDSCRRRIRTGCRRICLGCGGYL